MSFKVHLIWRTQPRPPDDGIRIIYLNYITRQEIRGAHHHSCESEEERLKRNSDESKHHNKCAINMWRCIIIVIIITFNYYYCLSLLREDQKIKRMEKKGRILSLIIIVK